MVASQKTLDMLKTIGLNKYERNLWVALISQGSSAAGELSDMSNVPRSRCYDVLESLADRGFVVIQPGKPIKYVAIHPREALDRAKKKIAEEAREVGEKIDRLVKSDAIKELERLHKETIKTTRPEELTGALKGRQALVQQMETMIRKAKKSIRLITTESGLEEISKHQLSHLKKASENGVRIELAAPITKKTSELAQGLAKFAHVRDIQNVEHVEKLLTRLCVVDGEEFLMGLTDDAKTHPTQDVALWAQSGHAASGTVEPLFQLVWNSAKPVK